MTSPQDLNRQVRQPHDEIIALYGLLEKTDKKVDTIAEVQQEHSRVLQQHGADLGSILQTLEAHETRLSVQSTSLRDMSHSMKRLEDNQRKQNDRLDGHSYKLDSHGEKLDSQGQKLDEILGLLQER